MAYVGLAQTPEERARSEPKSGANASATVSIDPSGHVDPVAMRSEEMKKLTLHPRDYIVYAHNAITPVHEQLLQRAEESGE